MRPLLLLTALLWSLSGEVRAEAEVREFVFPKTIVAVDGEKLDIAALVKRRTVVVVTLKATWCPVCQRQLVRLKDRLPELKPCGVSFLVLAPGPASELRAI